MSVADAFVERAHCRRNALRLSQAELARRMKARGFGWYPATVQRTETGERPLRLDEAVALADLLGLAAPFDGSALAAELAADAAVQSRIAQIAKDSADLLAAMAAQRDEAEARADRLANTLRRIHNLTEEPR